MMLYEKITWMALVKISAIEQYVIDAVKKKRTEKGMPQKELAYLLDTSIGFIGHVENPKLRHTYNLEHINELAMIFKCSPRDFLPEKPL
jgi:transcriptional regulator with XRE-family HTH domain